MMMTIEAARDGNEGRQYFKDIHVHQFKKVDYEAIAKVQNDRLIWTFMQSIGKIFEYLYQQNWFVLLSMAEVRYKKQQRDEENDENDEVEFDVNSPVSVINALQPNVASHPDSQLDLLKQLCPHTNGALSHRMANTSGTPSAWLIEPPLFQV